MGLAIVLPYMGFTTGLFLYMGFATVLPYMELLKNQSSDAQFASYKGAHARATS